MENPFQKITNDLSEIKYLISNLNLVQTKEEPEADIIEINAAGKIVNLAPATIYNKVNKKEIPHFKKGKKLFFSKAALIAWIKEGKTGKFMGLAVSPRDAQPPASKPLPKNLDDDLIPF